MRTPVRLLPLLSGALLAVLPGPACAATPPVAQRGLEVLERASRAYRDLPALTDTARYVLRVPGAAEHAESQEFGFGPGVELWICMPALYVMQAHGERLFLVEEGRSEPHIEASLAAGLQAGLDSAFGGRGAPLVPAPLALRRARDADEMLDAFRLKMLGPLRIVDVRREPATGGAVDAWVLMEAENGRVQARFDGRLGLLRALEAAFVPAPGQDSIRATARFSPQAGEAPAALDATQIQGGRRVAQVAELGGGDAPAPRALPPDSILLALDGRRVRLGDLVSEEGNYLLLEFWATWCAPCRGALPQVAKFAAWARDSARAVHVAYVNTQESFRDSAERVGRIGRYLASAGIVGPCLIDERSALHRSLGGGLPLTVIVARGGRIVETYGGYKPDLLETLKARARGLSGPRPSR